MRGGGNNAWKTRQRVWTKEKLDWLIESKNRYDDRDLLLIDFNKHFGTSITHKNLIVVNNNYRLHLPRSKSGQIKSKETLKLGYIKLRGFEKCEIGDEINYGDTYIKVNDTGKHSVDYKLKSKYLYEKYHNVKTEKHDIIVFLDGDRKNYSKENLYRISRSILTYMAFHGLYKKTSVDRLTKIKFCEWKEKINQLQVLSKN